MNLFGKKSLSRIFSVVVGVSSIIYILWIRYFYEDIPNLVKPLNDLTVFDYIIVGAGTAGSVLATTLSRKSNASILLIEAGHTFGLLTSNVPVFATFIQKSENDWSFLTTPQEYSSGAISNQRQCLPRGKGLGGSSQMNFMIHSRANKKDFDIWENLGLTEWSFDSLKPYLHEEQPFNKSSFQIVPNKADEFKLNIWQIPQNYTKISEAFENAKIEFNGNNLNFQRTEYTIKKGLRSNVYQIFLRPSFNNENFKIITNAVVDKVIFTKTRNAKAVSLKIKNGDHIKKIRVKARNEIILSAGAYSTPGILHRSGIGPKHVLDKLGVKTVFESPKVGENLFDHMTFPLFVSIEEKASVTVDKILNVKEIWKYLRTGQGYFSNFGVIGRIYSANDNYSINIFGTGSVDERILRDVSNFKQDAFRSIFPFYYNTSQEGMVILTTCEQPKSRGYVYAASLNPYESPLINPNYLKEKYDIDCMIKAVRTVVKVIFSKSFEHLKPKIHWAKSEQCKEFGPTENDFITNQPSDLYLECWMRQVALNSHHPSGSCSMGPSDDNSPLDEKLKVKGVSGLRVLDTSIFPMPVSATPNSILIAMAEKAADILLEKDKG